MRGKRQQTCSNVPSCRQPDLTRQETGDGFGHCPFLFIGGTIPHVVMQDWKLNNGYAKLLLFGGRRKYTLVSHLIAGADGQDAGPFGTRLGEPAVI